MDTLKLLIVKTLLYSSVKTEREFSQGEDRVRGEMSQSCDLLGRLEPLRIESSFFYNAYGLYA
jgi:hypothetical protein